MNELVEYMNQLQLFGLLSLLSPFVHSNISNSPGLVEQVPPKHCFCNYCRDLIRVWMDNCRRNGAPSRPPETSLSTRLWMNFRSLSHLSPMLRLICAATSMSVPRAAHNSNLQAVCSHIFLCYVTTFSNGFTHCTRHTFYTHCRLRHVLLTSRRSWDPSRICLPPSVVWRWTALQEWEGYGRGIRVDWMRFKTPSSWDMAGNMKGRKDGVCYEPCQMIHDESWWYCILYHIVSTLFCIKRRPFLIVIPVAFFSMKSVQSSCKRRPRRSSCYHCWKDARSQCSQTVSMGWSSSQDMSKP